MIASSGLQLAPGFIVAVASCVLCWSQKKGCTGAMLGLFVAIGFVFPIVGIIVVALPGRKTPGARGPRPRFATRRAQRVTKKLEERFGVPSRWSARGCKQQQISQL